MADEDLSVVSSEPAEPTIADQQPVDEPQAIPDTETPETELAASPVEDDGEEFEWEGQVFRGPKGLKDGVLMQKDYTQKTQFLSEHRKVLESREAEINQRAALTDEEMNLRVGLKTLDDQLAEFGKLTQADWDAHQDQDPMGTEKAWRAYQLLQQQRAEVAKNLTGAQSARAEMTQRESARRLQETDAYAAKYIPGWSDDLGKKLVEFGMAHGATQDFLRSNMSPALIQMLHWASLGKQTLSTPAPKPATTPAQPLRVVAAKSSPTTRTDLGKMDMDDYVAARKRGVGGKALAG